MAENSSTIEDTIRTYLASRGGSVEAPEGRGLTDEMARAIGVDPPLALSPILRDMESNGLIRRQVRGLLTYRIELVTPAGPAATENGAPAASDTIPPVSAGEAPPDATRPGARPPRLRRPGPATADATAEAAGAPAPPTAEMPAATAEGEVPPATTDQLPVVPPDRTAPVRKGAGRRAPRPKRETPPLPGDEAPAGTPGAAAETTTVTSPPAPGAPDTLTPGETVTPAEEAPPAVVPPPVSDAITPAEAAPPAVVPSPVLAPDPASTVPPSTAAEPAAESAPAVTPVVVPPSEPAPTPDGQADPTATQPIAAATAAPGAGAAAATEAPAFDTSVVSPPPPSSAPADAPFVNPWGTPVPSAPPVGAPGAPAAAATTTTTKTKTRRIRTEGLRSRLEMPVQDIKSEPNQTTIIAVAVAGIGLVLIAIIAVIVAHATTHHAATGTFSQSTDACRVVTAEDASTLFGVDAGNPHFVLGTCVYDDGSNELIVAVFRQQARAMYETARSSDARDIANVGDSAYYQDGRLRVLKGTNLLELTVSPIPPNWPSPKMLTLANTALGRL